MTPTRTPHARHYRMDSYSSYTMHILMLTSGTNELLVGCGDHVVRAIRFSGQLCFLVPTFDQASFSTCNVFVKLLELKSSSWLPQSSVDWHAVHKNKRKLRKRAKRAGSRTPYFAALTCPKRCRIIASAGELFFFLSFLINMGGSNLTGVRGPKKKRPHWTREGALKFPTELLARDHARMVHTVKHYSPSLAYDDGTCFDGCNQRANVLVHEQC